MNIFGFMGDAIDGIIKQFLGQTGLLGDLVIQPLQGLVSQVTGGIWKGNGADKFVQEMQQKIVPQLQNLGQSNNNFAGGLQKSVSAMEQAFGQANSIAQGLFDVVNSIF